MLTFTLQRRELDDKKRKHRCSDSLKVKMFFSLPGSSSASSSTHAGVVAAPSTAGVVFTDRQGNIVSSSSSSDVVDAEVLHRTDARFIDPVAMRDDSELLRTRQQQQQYHHFARARTSSAEGVLADARSGATELQSDAAADMLGGRAGVEDMLGMHSETSSFHSESEANLSEDEVDSDANVLDNVVEQRHHQRHRHHHPHRRRHDATGTNDGEKNGMDLVTHLV